jgi:hypothetical protein
MKLKTAIREAIKRLEDKNPLEFSFTHPIYYNFEKKSYEVGDYVDRHNREKKPNLLEVCRVPAWNQNYSESRKKREKAQMVKSLTETAENSLIEYKAACRAWIQER